MRNLKSFLPDIMVEELGNVAQAALYCPFGELIYEENAYWMLDTIPRYLFNGKELDEESGMYYYSARYYSPPSFISRDPLFEKYPWISSYAYCANNPVRYIDPDGQEPIKPPYMITVSDCFGYGSSTPSFNTWPSIPSVIPKDKFIGWGHNDVKNCFKLANYQLAKVGCSTNGKYYQAYTEQKGVNKDQTQKAVKYITAALKAGNPVMIGVDDQDGHPGNNDKTTDHWIVIVGMGSDKKGNYFNFYDNATSNREEDTSSANKLYYDAKTGKITGTADNDYSRNADRDYTVTRVKETQQNTNNNQ